MKKGAILGVKQRTHGNKEQNRSKLSLVDKTVYGLRRDKDKSKAN